jgi:ABC-type antimicrobial peptide transport system permease subunit
MNILKTALSVGAGLLATAACYLFMSGNKKSGNENTKNSQVNNQDNNNGIGSVKPMDDKSDNVLKKLDKFQVGLINFARFISEVVRAISLFIRAMRCYEYDVSYSN